MDNLIVYFANLNVHKSNSKANIEKMPPQPVDMSLLRFQTDNIPHFDCNTNHQNKFIISCENFRNNFQNTQD